MNTKRYLITTADERSWKFDRPILFLGEWCRLYDRKSVWDKLDAIVAPPYGICEEEKQSNYKIVKEVVKGLLPELCDFLNNYHGTHYSMRYWRILLGHWLHRCISVLYNRYHVISHTLCQYKLLETTVFYSNETSLAVLDSEEFIWACNDHFWNNILYSRVLDFFSPVHNIKINVLEGKKYDEFKFEKENLKKYNTRLFVEIIKLVAKKFVRDKDAVILNSYLSKKIEMNLCVALGQLPQAWNKISLLPCEPSSAARTKHQIDTKNHSGFSLFVRKILLEMLPICFLEGYASWREQMQSFGWPRKPKFIFTSNNFDTDEIFKLWAAELVERKTQYLIGQHGNNYGTSQYCFSEDECIAVCDKFITWGWRSNSPKCVPAFIFKNPLTKADWKASGNLLLIETCLPHRIDIWDSYWEFDCYMGEQFSFVNNLSSNIKKQITVRLHSEYKKHRWREEERWKDFDPSIRLECGKSNIKKLISQSRLVVHSYDSTGILETLSSNVPTLCFWRDSLAHLRESAKPWYQLLIDTEIIFATPDQAAKKVCKIWPNIHEWWNSTDVQYARKAFCEHYARGDSNPVRSMKKILINNI